MRIRNTLAKASHGACCGLSATVPMTAAMLIIQRLLPASHREQLEPRQIVDCLIDRLGAGQHMPESRRQLTALLAHFGYGTATGAAYPLFRQVFGGLPACGAAYGATLFAVSYAGWLPALDILPLPRDRPPGRNLMLIVSHLVWGATLESLYAPMRKQPAIKARP